MESLSAFLKSYEAPPVPVVRDRRARVLAILELRDSKRRWFVVGAEERDGRYFLVGYEPPCRYSPSDGWFRLPSDFFMRAALASGDSLDVHTNPAGSLAELDLAESC